MVLTAIFAGLLVVPILNIILFIIYFLNSKNLDNKRLVKDLIIMVVFFIVETFFTVDTFLNPGGDGSLIIQILFVEFIGVCAIIYQSFAIINCLKNKK